MFSEFIIYNLFYCNNNILLSSNILSVKMGQANCACVKTVSVDHQIEIANEKRLPSNRLKETSHFNQQNEVDKEIRLLKSIIRIQALLRGWLARRKYHNV